jgi:hypothetical protein
MTLFGAVSPDPVFLDAIAKFYGGRPDPATLDLLAPKRREQGRAAIKGMECVPGEPHESQLPSMATSGTDGTDAFL